MRHVAPIVGPVLVRGRIGAVEDEAVDARTSNNLRQVVDFCRAWSVPTEVNRRRSFPVARKRRRHGCHEAKPWV